MEHAIHFWQSNTILKGWGKLYTRNLLGQKQMEYQAVLIRIALWACRIGYNLLQFKMLFFYKLFFYKLRAVPFKIPGQEDSPLKMDPIPGFF